MRWLVRSLLILFAAAVLALAAADWLCWQLRIHAGHGYSTVTVSHVVVAPLKGHREEYYPDGTVEEPCSRSFLPWGATTPCWYLNRHRVVIAR